MKYAIIIPDGAADEPLKELNGKTPLEAAHTPNMDRVSLEGLRPQNLSHRPRSLGSRRTTHSPLPHRLGLSLQSSNGH